MVKQIRFATCWLNILNALILRIMPAGPLSISFFIKQNIDLKRRVWWGNLSEVAFRTNTIKKCDSPFNPDILHYAAADPNGEHMIKVLQKSGGDAFIEDKLGHTPFYYRTHAHGKWLNIRTLKDNAVINQLISGQLNRPLLQGRSPTQPSNPLTFRFGRRYLGLDSYWKCRQIRGISFERLCRLAVRTNSSGNFVFIPNCYISG